MQCFFLGYYRYCIWDFLKQHSHIVSQNFNSDVNKIKFNKEFGRKQFFSEYIDSPRILSIGTFPHNMYCIEIVLVGTQA